MAPISTVKIIAVVFTVSISDVGAVGALFCG